MIKCKFKGENKYQNKAQTKLFYDIWEVRVNKKHIGYFESYKEANDYVNQFRLVQN